MDILKILPIVLIVFVSGCTAQVGKTNPQENQNVTPPEQPQQEIKQVGYPTGQGTPQSEVQQPSPSPPAQTVKEFAIEADDRGFYLDNQQISSVSVGTGNVVKITFKVREVGTYYGGLDFRGCNQNVGEKPGNSVTVQFTADNTCTVTSYWPSSGVVKSNLQITVS